MPFGLTNAPSTFQCLMNDVLKPYLRRFVLVFFDDILVYSKDVKENAQHLSLVFQKLQEHQLFSKKSKCAFGTTRVEYLGHVIQQGGLTTDPQKIAAAVAWPVPNNLKQLKGFLRLVGYYRRFIRQYGVISKPLTELLKKDGFHLTQDATSAFEKLKEALTTALVLSLPSPDKQFIVETDACDVGIRVVLM